MRHVVSIQGYGQHKGSIVHLAGVNDSTLCGLQRLTKVIEDERLPLVSDTRREVNCQACHKALEMLVRRKLTSLPTSVLEGMFEEIS